MPQAQPLKTGDPLRLGDYELSGRLGEGGQGVVFLATRPADGDAERYAVKLLYAPLGDEEAAFLREAELAKQVARFCTAQVIDAGVEAGRPFIVSEYVDGPSLQREVVLAGPRTGGALERLAVGTATALAAIHRAGIVHRDFKPQNVLLGPDGPRVIDFGLARALDAAATLSGRGMGTPAYMSPEQIGAEDLTPAVDVFAWGATICFAATGQAPFGQDSVAAVLHRILTAHPETGRIPGHLRGLVEQCLDKTPRNRPASRELVLALLGEAPSGSGSYYLGAAAAGVAPERPEEDIEHTGPVGGESGDPPDGRSRRAVARMSVAAFGAILVSAIVLAVVLVPALFTQGGARSGPSPATTGTLGVTPQKADKPATEAPATMTDKVAPPAAASTAPVAVTVVVPEVAGLDRAAAVRSIRRAGLRPGEITEADSPERIGRVLSATPAAGTSVRKGSKVRLRVSAGIEVPAVAGLRRAAAESALSAAGLSAGKVSRACSELPGGQVIASHPAAGARVAGGTAVSLVVSRRGKEVPGVVGMPEADAGTALAALGFTVDRRTRVTGSADLGKVLAQSLPPGSCAAPGAKITITVGVEGADDPSEDPGPGPRGDDRDPTDQPDVFEPATAVSPPRTDRGGGSVPRRG
ncbi:PASTA domain-containing protein [Spongiactinospora sp. 9N601]|uniref:PASTA domain-containing protein n=1 Tax=Spongiactinospora sp. 9N601 TaxID=3375149 RepID=UPI003789782D